jgi:hypothetical protein
VRRSVGSDLVLRPGASVVVSRDDGRGQLGRRFDNDWVGRPWRRCRRGLELRRHNSCGAARGSRHLHHEADLDAFPCISRVDNHLETYPERYVTH